MRNTRKVLPMDAMRGLGLSLILLAGPARADDERGAFCEVTHVCRGRSPPASSPPNARSGW